MYDIGVSSDTTFTATYSTTSDSVLVEYCSFVDYGVTNKKNTNWQNYLSRLAITTDENGTTLTKGSSNGYYLADNGQIIFDDYIVEFDIVSIENQCIWYHQTSDAQTQDIVNFATYCTGGESVKIVCNNNIANLYVDNVKKTNDINITASSAVEIGFRINSHATISRSIKYKNLRVKAL